VDDTICEATCPAVHAVQWWKAEGRRLVRLCGHHSREHGPALVAAGYLAMGRLDAGADVLVDQP
jgi:hypothetical protein